MTTGTPSLPTFNLKGMFGTYDYIPDWSPIGGINLAVIPNFFVVLVNMIVGVFNILMTFINLIVGFTSIAIIVSTQSPVLLVINGILLLMILAGLWDLVMGAVGKAITF